MENTIYILTYGEYHDKRTEGVFNTYDDAVRRIGLDMLEGVRVEYPEINIYEKR